MKMETGIKFVRLVTGEDLISEVTEVEQGGERQYIVTSPLKVLYTPSKEGGLSISLVQWIFWRICESQDYNLKPSDVLLIADASSSIEEYYWNTLNYYDELRSDQSKENDSFDSNEDGDETLQQILDMLQENKDKRKLH